MKYLSALRTLGIILATGIFFQNHIVAQNSTGTVTMIICGDVLPESSWLPAFSPAEKLFENVSEEFQSADIVFINLEEPITTSTVKTKHKNPKSVARGKDFILKAKNLSLPKIFKNSGIDVINLANNHMGDYGSRGIVDTLRLLKAESLLTVGAGKNLSEATKVLEIEINGIKISLLGYTDVCPPGFAAARNRPGVASSKNPEVFLASVRRAKKRADFVVVMMHWGDHATSKVNDRQKELAKMIADSGADLVAGMHSHFLQPVELYKGKPIFYSLGNFAFPGKREESRRSVYVKVHLNLQKLLQTEIIPISITPDGKPKIVKGEEEGNLILSHLNTLSQPFGTILENGQPRKSE